MDSCTIPIAPRLKISKEDDDDDYGSEEEFSMTSLSVKYVRRARSNGVRPRY